jgi:hypothetical protein
MHTCTYGAHEGASKKSKTAHRDLTVIMAIGKSKKRHGGHAIVLARCTFAPPSTSSISEQWAWAMKELTAEP